MGFSSHMVTSTKNNLRLKKRRSIYEKPDLTVGRKTQLDFSKNHESQNQELIYLRRFNLKFLLFLFILIISIILLGLN